MTIFPFVIKYEKEIPSTAYLQNILLVIENGIDEERGKYYKEPIIENNCLIFTNYFMSRSIFHAINKGKFTIILNNNTVKLTYRFFMYRFFLIYIIGGTLLAIFNKSIISSFYLSCWLYILMIWIGSVISNKLFFNRIVKKIGDIGEIDKKFKIQT
jgi:hypothetical protein